MWCLFKEITTKGALCIYRFTNANRCWLWWLCYICAAVHYDCAPLKSGLVTISSTSLYKHFCLLTIWCYNNRPLKNSSPRYARQNRKLNIFPPHLAWYICNMGSTHLLPSMHAWQQQTNDAPLTCIAGIWICTLQYMPKNIYKLWSTCTNCIHNNIALLTWTPTT